MFTRAHNENELKQLGPAAGRRAFHCQKHHQLLPAERRYHLRRAHDIAIKQFGLEPVDFVAWEVNFAEAREL